MKMAVPCFTIWVHGFDAQPFDAHFVWVTQGYPLVPSISLFARLETCHAFEIRD